VTGNVGHIFVKFTSVLDILRLKLQNCFYICPIYEMMDPIISTSRMRSSTAQLHSIPLSGYQLLGGLCIVEGMFFTMKLVLLQRCIIFL
jgi:hypothetical protein